MALIKEILLKNGVKVSYHRIVGINNITNNTSIINVYSYINKNKREEEKQKGSLNVFIAQRNFEKEYDKNLNVVSAYSYLKTLPEFENALDD